MSPPVIPVIIVGFRNPDDILDALEALSRAQPDPRFTVHICENGGPKAYDALLNVLSTDERSALLDETQAVFPAHHQFRRLRAFRLRGVDADVFVGDAGENLGYGGGINRWLRPLMGQEWPGVFILNPDAAPYPDALGQLKAYSDSAGKGMVTGRIILEQARDRIQTRGLRYRPMRAITEAVGRHAPSEIPPDVAEIERMLDAPSGAALYVTRSCIERIGLMREDYFLYYEDLDWGLKAKRSCGLGYATDAAIMHKGGTTIGSGDRRSGSALSTFLEFRNRLLFVRSEMPRWYPWTILMSFVRAFMFVRYGRLDNVSAALQGVLDGLIGRSGRPDAWISRHLEGRSS